MARRRGPAGGALAPLRGPPRRPYQSLAMSRARAALDERRPTGGRRSSDILSRPVDDGMPKPGETISGKYSLVRKIGQGGMAVVYEALHLRLNQRLAIKVLRPNIPEFEEVLARFEREARATVQLRSIHSARVVDVDTLADGLPYIVMEFLEGLNLEKTLETTGPMSIEDAADIVIQVTDVMAEAHSLGIVHRDLKPSNLFVCHVGDRRLIKVLDFGISKIENEMGARITQADSYFGTPCYAAPEQLRAAAEADARSDVWSLGIILFELLTGRPPFVGNPTAVIAKVMTDPVPWPLNLRPDIPRELARIILRALSRHPSQRYQSMRDLAAALVAFAPAQTAASVVEAQRTRGRLGEYPGQRRPHARGRSCPGARRTAAQRQAAGPRPARDGPGLPRRHDDGPRKTAGSDDVRLARVGGRRPSSRGSDEAASVQPPVGHRARLIPRPSGRHSGGAWRRRRAALRSRPQPAVGAPPLTRTNRDAHSQRAVRRARARRVARRHARLSPLGSDEPRRGWESKMPSLQCLVGGTRDEALAAKVAAAVLETSTAGTAARPGRGTAALGPITAATTSAAGASVCAGRSVFWLSSWDSTRPRSPRSPPSSTT